MNIGRLVKEARERIGITQKELASRLSVHTMTISRIERGDTNTDTKMLNDIAIALGISFRDLLGFKDTVKPILTEGWLEIPLLDPAYSACGGGGNGLYDIEATATGNVVVAREWIDGAIEPYKPFGVRVEGDSMEQAGIPDGTIAVINPNVAVENGDIAFFSVNGSWMVKGVLWRSDGGVELIPANPNYQKLSYDKDEMESGWVKIIGKVVYSLQARKPKRFL